MRSLDEEILRLLRGGAVTPDEVAKRLRISWATANGHLLRLVGEGKALLVRKGRVNVYQAKSVATLHFAAARWVRPKPLQQLAEELVDYFPANVTAAEMIEKERRKA